MVALPGRAITLAEEFVVNLLGVGGGGAAAPGGGHNLAQAGRGLIGAHPILPFGGVDVAHADAHPVLLLLVDGVAPHFWQMEVNLAADVHAFGGVQIDGAGEPTAVGIAGRRFPHHGRQGGVYTRAAGRVAVELEAEDVVAEVVGEAEVEGVVYLGDARIGLEAFKAGGQAAQVLLAVLFLVLPGGDAGENGR